MMQHFFRIGWCLRHVPQRGQAAKGRCAGLLRIGLALVCCVLGGVLGSVVGLARAWAAGGGQVSRPFVIGMSQEFDSLNPLLSSASSAAAVRAFVNRDLVSVDSQGSWHADLALAIPSLQGGDVRIESVGAGSSRQETTVAHWILKPSARWGDSTPVTCADVRFSWQLGRHPLVPVAARKVYEDILDVACDPKSPKQVTIRLAGHRPDHFKLDGLKILPAHIEKPAFDELQRTQRGDSYLKRTEYARHPLNPALYNGPFRVRESVAGSHVSLVPNEQFYGPRPHLRRGVVLRVIPDAAALQAHLRSGAIDMIHAIGLGPDQIEDLRSVIRREQLPFRVVDYTGPVYEHVVFNLKDPWLGDERVRRALLLGLDRDSMLQALFAGRVKPAMHYGSPTDPYWSGGLPLDPKSVGYSPRRARSLLAEAGFVSKPGEAVLRRDGKPLSLTLVTTSGNSSRARVATYMQEQWRQIGVDLRLEFVPARVFFGEVVAKRGFAHMAMFAEELEWGEVPVELLDPRRVPEAGNGFAGANYAAWNEPLLAELTDEYRAAFDPSRRRALAARITGLYVAALPHLPLFFKPTAQVVPADLENGPGLSYFSGLQAESWKQTGEAGRVKSSKDSLALGASKAN